MLKISRNRNHSKQSLLFSLDNVCLAVGVQRCSTGFIGVHFFFVARRLPSLAAARERRLRAGRGGARAHQHAARHSARRFGDFALARAVALLRENSVAAASKEEIIGQITS